MVTRRFPPFGSIRFRLTAWYTLLLALIVLGVGLALSTLLERELRQDVDDRMSRTAGVVAEQAEAIPLANFGQSSFFLQVPKEINPLAAPGQAIQVTNQFGEVVYQTGGLDSQSYFSVKPPSSDSSATYYTASVNDITIRLLRASMVLENTNEFAGTVIVVESIEPLLRTLDLLRKLVLLGSAVGIGLAALGGWFFAGRALQPVDRVTEAAAAIAADNGSARSLATRLDVPHTGDELARLAATFNQMLDRLESSFSAQRRFIADASHELRTPLTAIRGNIDVLHRQARIDEMPAQDDLLEALDDLRRESARMGRLLSDLLLLARSDSSDADFQERRRPVYLDAVARDAVRTAESLAHGQDLLVDALLPVVVEADRDRLEQLLLILLDNAIRHTPPDGEIVVSAVARGDAALLAVHDTGAGIAPEHLPHLFDRFYRAETARDRTSGGTGLGLAIARAIARGHGGNIAVNSVLGVGSTFTVTIPLTATGSPVGRPIVADPSRSTADRRGADDV